ncbi:MAG: nucleotidyltransferase family protein [Lachnospiraceae bacterium]|nr:nucleotidyltransferase family protein [Lachnospiraceae bacterium]
MKTCGIIAEFNPFHNGHAKLFEYAKQELGADHIIVVMSGDHVQRGEPALSDKYSRTEAALRSGADLVLELPVYSAVSSARDFARGAVAALINSGITDMLLFGSESGDIDRLRNSASEDPAFIKEYALRPSPNDALATGYLRALDHFSSGMKAVTLKREGAGYNDMTPVKDNASAAYIRSLLLASDETAYTYMPPFSEELLSSYTKTSRLMELSSYSALLGYTLNLKSREDLCTYAGIWPDLADKIIKYLPEYTGFTPFIEKLKSKDLTYSHISRALLHVLLDIRNEDFALFSKGYAYCPYLRILGIKKEAAELLHAFGKNASVPVISRLSDAEKLLDEEAYSLLSREIKASGIYQQCSSLTLPFRSEYSRFLIRM